MGNVIMWNIFKETQEALIKMGGPKSGHYGHRGRKGKRGGSAPSKGTNKSNAFDTAKKVGIVLPSSHLEKVTKVVVNPQMKDRMGHAKGTVIEIRSALESDYDARVFGHEVGHVLLNTAPNPKRIVARLYNTPLFKAFARNEVIAKHYHYDAETIAKETFAEYYSRHFMGVGTPIPPWVLNLFEEST